MSVQDLIDQSGYPLQIKLKDLVTESWGKQQDRWRFLFDEHHWVNGNQEGYIDLVLRSAWEPRGPNVRLVIECKRIDGIWCFISTPDEQSTQTAYVLYLESPSENHHALWRKTDFYPTSRPSQFCVMGLYNDRKGKKKGDNENEDKLGRDTRTLEKWAGELLLATEALAEERNIEPAPHQICVPVIVTTAQIQVCTLDPATINLDDGALGKMELQDQWVVRFHKNMATSKRYGSEITSLEQVHEAGQRTVFVVQAKEFVKFLRAMWFS